VGGRGAETLRISRRVCQTGQVFRASRDWQTSRTQTCRLLRQKRQGGLAGWTSRKDIFDKSMVGSVAYQNL
jgi:hypothetical protein